MRKFIFLIGSKDMFESLEDLTDIYFNDPGLFRELDGEVIEFELSMKSSNKTALSVGRDHAFENGWYLDDAFYALLEA